MKNKELQKLFNINKSNSGFTLTELLIGLVMGTIVIGGLGFGLVNLLQNTQTQTARSEAKNNSARALDFITDEVKRAIAIENTDANANGFNDAGRTVVFALDIPEVNGDSDPDGDGNLFGVDNDTTTSERIIYFLESSSGTNWKGPLVLNRWGPAFDDNGNYTDGSWQTEALIDGISDTTLAAGAIQCEAGQTTTPAAPTGFYACIEDGISAQLYLTSGIDIGRKDESGNKIVDTHTANTQVVARARTAPSDNSDNFTSYTMSYKTLGAVYGCDPSGSGTNWQMRTDFINNPSDPNSEEGNRNKKWVHKENRQPQPIKIDTTSSLTINSIPVEPESVDCISKGGKAAANGFPYDNESLTADGLESVYYTDGSGNYTTKNGDPLPSGTDPIFKDDAAYGDVYHRVSHTIDFTNPLTYNGYETGGNDVFVGNGSQSTVLFLRPGDLVPANPGYDADADAGTTDNNQESLRDFLDAQGYLNSDYTVRGAGDPISGTDKYLGKDERIVIFEVGQTESDKPGFDRQDNIFILSSDVFANGAP